MDKAILDAVASGAYIMGKPVKELEAQLAEYVGVKHCLSCANGTDALTLALKAWGIGPGDAVFVPDFTFFSSAEVVPLEGATPVFVDVREETFNIDAADLQSAVEQVLAEGSLRPRVVVAVDLFGLPADYKAIRQVADKYGLFILEVFTDNDEWAALIESYRVHGKGAFKYDNVRIGMNSRLDTVQAAVLQVKLKAFTEYELDAVNAAAGKYTELLKDVVDTPVIPQGFRSSWAQYTIRLKDTAQRDALQASLKAAGIPSMVYYPKPMHLQTAFRAEPRNLCPVATSLCGRVLSLPMHPYITDEEINTVCGAVKAALK